MAYNKTIWQDLPNETTPIDAEHLNKIENELEALDTDKADKTVATTSANGLMSADDKSKLNNITKPSATQMGFEQYIVPTTNTSSENKVLKSIEITTHGYPLVIVGTLNGKSNGGTAFAQIGIDNNVYSTQRQGLGNDWTTAIPMQIRRDVPAGNHTVKLVVSKGNATSWQNLGYAGVGLIAFEIPSYS